MIKHILLIDDALVNIEFLEMLFVKHEVEVHKAMKADDVLELVEQQKFDISLVDYHMPGIDGVEMLNHLDNQGKLSRLGTIFILTADIGFDPDKMGVNKFISGCLYKPLDVNQLEAALFPEAA